MVSRLDVAILIACLGAVAVVAVPRHERLSAELRESEVAALTRATATAAELAHTRWLAARKPPTIDGTRGLVAMTHGYPSAGTLPMLLSKSETENFRYDSGVWQHASRRADQPCGVVYQAPLMPGQQPAIRPNTSGC